MKWTQNMKVVNAIPADAIKDNAAFAAVGVDTLGYRYATFIFSFGATDIAAAVFKIQEADADSGYADITGLDWSVAPLTLPAASAGTAGQNNIIACIDLEKRKRWLKPAVTAGNGSTGTYMSAICILSDSLETPATSKGRGVIADVGTVVNGFVVV